MKNQFKKIKISFVIRTLIQNIQQFYCDKIFELYKGTLKQIN